MKKQYVKPVVTVVKMTESHAIMAGSVKLNGCIRMTRQRTQTTMESVSTGAVRRRTIPKRKRMASCGVTNLSPLVSQGVAAVAL